MPVSRPPRAALRPFIGLLWAFDAAERSSPARARELVLPTGSMHLVVRLTDRPFRMFRGEDDAAGLTIEGPVIGGNRSGPYIRDVSEPGGSVGAMLRPGACAAVLGMPARPLAEAHTALEDVWGRAAVAELTERLEAASTAEARLELFEAALEARLPALRGLNPLVAEALAGLHARRSVGAVVEAAGCSHRHLKAVFGEAVGLNPKAYARVLRFRRMLARLRREPAIAWAELAAAAGYADQAHLAREFRQFAGVTPGRYRRLAPASPHHVPLR